jgi:hypothetical protein
LSRPEISATTAAAATVGIRAAGIIPATSIAPFFIHHMFIQRSIREMIACWDRDTVVAPTFEVAHEKNLADGYGEKPRGEQTNCLSTTHAKIRRYRDAVEMKQAIGSFRYPS